MNEDFIVVDGREYVSKERYQEVVNYCHQLRQHNDALQEDLEAIENKVNQDRESLLGVTLMMSKALGNERETKILLNIDQERAKELTESALIKAKAIPKRYPGYIYLIKDIDVTGFHKIGYSVRPKIRMLEFRTEWPFRCELIHLFKVRNMHEVESTLHRQYQKKRKRGEWFKLNTQDVEYIKSLQDE